MPNEGDSWYFHKTWSDFRRGSLRLRLGFGAEQAIALLYDEGVPRTVAAIAAHLPLEVPVVHVAWSGEMVMSTRAYDIPAKEPENQVRLVRPGDLAWDPKFGELTVTYGTAEAKLPSGPNTLVVYGQIVEGLEVFAAFGRARRFEGVGRITFSKD